MPRKDNDSGKNRRDPYDPRTGATGGDTEPAEDARDDEVKKHGDAVEPLVDREGASTRRDRGGRDDPGAAERTRH